MNMNYNSSNQSYLTFQLANEIFAIHAGRVIKILEMQKITEVPRAPSFMKGVINLRGDVLPVIDAREKFGMMATAYGQRTCILVLTVTSENETLQVGAIVDAVLDVVKYPDDQIKKAPALGSRYSSEVVAGVMKTEDDFIIILNVDHVFSTDEIISLNENMQSQTENLSASSQTKLKQ
ncbi:MAG: chemotaxis protein CheW [Bacteroidales bacterium]|nr:chemotaxis protein CheW [Bacteroidales bacterium]